MKNDYSLYELIEKYDFSELTKEQQQFVLTEVSSEEYTEFRNTIMETAAYFDEQPVLMAEDLIVPELKTENVLIKMANYKLPVYKVAAAMIVVLFINNLIPEGISTNVQVAETQNEFIIDTDTFLTYNRYSSKNSIKYDEGLSKVYY
jgi:hypothetical protein